MKNLKDGILRMKNKELNTPEFYSKVYNYLSKNQFAYYDMTILSINLQEEDNKYGVIGENYVVQFKYFGRHRECKGEVLIPVKKFKMDMTEFFIVTETEEE